MDFEWMNKTDKTRWISVNQKDFKPFLDSTMACYSCHDEVVKGNNSWLGKCKTCGALISFFKGTPIQDIACAIDSPIVFNIGAVGSGKTTISSYIMSNHMRTFPGAKVLAFALTLHQLKQYAIPEMDKFLHPMEFKQKTQTHWVLNNGSAIEFTASDNEDKVRSANATAIWLIEAAPNKMRQIYKQGLQRLRNSAAMEYVKDDTGKIVLDRLPDGKIIPRLLRNNTIMLVEANVKKGSWLKKELLKSHTIFYTESVRGIPILKEAAKPLSVIGEYSGLSENYGLITILNASKDNPILAESFFTSIKASMDTEEEYNREIYCDMTAEDGLVFKDVIPNFNKIFVPMHDTYTGNPNLLWVESIDPGGSKEDNDPTAYLLMQLDITRKTIKVIDFFKQSGLTPTDEALMIHNIRSTHNYTKSRSLLFTGDNAMERSLKTDKYQSLKTDYEIRLGSTIQVCNAKGIKQGIDKLLDWFRSDAITISDHIEPLKHEMLMYETITKKDIVKDSIVETQKFSEGEEHLLDALRYAIVMLESMGYRQDQYRIDMERDAMIQMAKLKQHQKSQGDYMGNLIEKVFTPQLQKNNVVKNNTRNKIVW